MKGPDEAKTAKEAAENFPDIKDSVVGQTPDGGFILSRGNASMAERFKQSHCITCREETEEEERSRLGRNTSQEGQEASPADLGSLNSGLGAQSNSWTNYAQQRPDTTRAYDYSFYEKMKNKPKP